MLRTIIFKYIKYSFFIYTLQKMGLIVQFRNNQ